MGRWWPGTGGLPAQVIHGDLAPSNLLADPDSGEVTGLLDFEHAGKLQATTQWLAANADAFLSVAAAANAGS